MEAQMFFFKRLLRVLWFAVLFCILIYGLGVTGYVALRLVMGERWDTIAFANNFVPWWALGGLIGVLFAAFSRWRWPLLALQAPILILFVVVYGELFWPNRIVAEAGNGISLTAATYNTLSLQSDPQQVITVINELNTDIIGLQEVGPDLADLIAQQLAQQYPYQALHPAEAEHGVAFLSRYPILEEQVFFPFQKYVRHLRVLIDVNGTQVVVYVVHPHTPNPYFPPTAYNTHFRDEQLAALRDRLKTDLAPILVLCDCNTTDQSDAYHALDNMLVDSFREAGWGLGFTFPARILEGKLDVPRMIRIDYVWHNQYFVATNAQVGDDSGTSDHRPVIASLLLNHQSED